jgi:hypothetical protein
MIEIEMDVNFVLKELRNIIEDPEVKTKDRLEAIKMCGQFLKMFDRQSKVQVDIRGLIAQMSNQDLKRLTDNGIKNIELEASTDDVRGHPDSMHGSIRGGI